MSLSELSIDALQGRARAFDGELSALKANLGTPELWHPHGGVAEVVAALSTVLSGDHRDLSPIVGDGSIADICGTDGELAFFMESLGLRATIVDSAATNFSGLAGARRLKEARNSGVEIKDVDIDGTPYLTGWYDLAFLLDRLFHYKNPYGALERLARRARHCILSTRVMRMMPDKRANVARYPLAYLVDGDDAGGDSSAYWVFTEAGLRRIVSRAGWTVLDYGTVGNVVDSDPASVAGDERAFVLLHSGTYG